MEKKGQISGAVGWPLSPLPTSLSMYACVCGCVHVCWWTCVFVCLRGDSVLDLIRTKLIRDFSLHDSTMTFPQEPGQHLPPILHPPERERHCRDVFIHHLKQILQASGKWKKVSAMCVKRGQWKEQQWAKMKRRLCWILGDFDIIFNPFLPFTANFISQMPVVVSLTMRILCLHSQRSQQQIL